MSRAVATAFASPLTGTRGGLSFTAIRGGQVIYDLRGGWADRGHRRAWDTRAADRARLFGPPPDAFGHTGAGGSAHGYWPSEGVAFSFAINELQNEADDRRCRDVLAALHSELLDD